MAKKGLSCFLAAPLNEEESTYGNIVKMIGAVSAKKTLAKNNEELAGDNTTMIEDKSVTGGSLDISILDDDPTIFDPIIGKKKRKMTIKLGNTTKEIEYYVGNGNDTCEAYGFGYVEKEKIPGNKIKYRVWFFPKTTWSNYDTNAETEGKTANYQKPSVKGTLFKLDNQDYEYDVRVDTLLEAVTVLYKFFGKDIPAEEAAKLTITEATEESAQENA